MTLLPQSKQTESNLWMLHAIQFDLDLQGKLVELGCLKELASAEIDRGDFVVDQTEELRVRSLDISVLVDLGDLDQGLQSSFHFLATDEVLGDAQEDGVVTRG
jgi:hypothetical protein